ncbi:MAG: hypothetical protein EXS16_07955 [Gemmataceae bacterium]|nr:hypothetical protein [Gemmataceae bacterium]
MSLSAGRYQLANAFKSLKQEWDSTEGVWRDIVRKDYNDHHWEPLEARLASILSATDRLELEVAKMRSECGTERE